MKQIWFSNAKITIVQDFKECQERFLGTQI